MTVASYILGVVAALLVLVIVIEMLRRGKLRERHALWWLIAGVLALIAGVFPKTLEWAAHLVGVQLPTNLVFFVSIAILFLVCLQHSAELTTMETKTRALAEQSAMQELRIRELERQAGLGDRLAADESDAS
ncbi:DUF2304 domain-containing protein [Humibacter ginsenosidimutans]|uniref:DUF2304 domain-containing protein n=1 Tax=Humibacter ginsenosidimutans TaxID=2599293 RepID=A0A5B8M897_9MICO|nr:DUF2304 domain-containing protein [Humibacter ginsenosidimutans]QDZ16441.1 DUF2304 domain-containing protein [Humibacter ginsenosidimutans]